MRSMLLALNILIGVSIVTTAPDIFAATSKSSKSKGQKLYRAHLKKKAAVDPGDVWDRIRLGMRIPHPVATQTVRVTAAEKTATTKSDELNLKMAAMETGTASASMKIREAPEGIQTLQDSNLKIRPHTVLAPTNNYTELGRIRLGSRSTSAKIVDCTPSTPSQVRQEYAQRNRARIAQLNDQIKASMDFHPELRKHTVILGPKSLSSPDTSVDASEKPAPAVLSERSQIGHLTKINRLNNPCAARTEANIASNEPATGKPKTTLADITIHSDKTIVKIEQDNSRQAMIDERINRQIASYTQNPGFLHRVAERAHPYIYHIVEGLSRNRMPLDLALLPIVESAYQPTAQSPKSAAGLWQFIPSTGKDFNLEQSSEYDERLDIPESTQAAIQFLSGLKNHFKGDWLLALAAYNSGQGTVDNAINRNLAEGLPTDFWSLRLPEETQNYVPRLLALSNIFSRPGAYGIKLPAVRNEPYFVKVKINRAFDVNYLTEKEISTVAQLANLSPEQFNRLNPGFLNPTLPKDDAYTFLMPEPNAKQLQDRLASIEKFLAASAITEKQPVAVKSIVLIEEPKPKAEMPESTLSLVNQLVANKTPEADRFPTPFLSLNVDEASNRLI